MKRKLTLSLTLLTMFMWISTYSQTPTLLNYPLVKGYYQSAQKDSTVLFCMTDYGLMIWDVTNLHAPALISKLPAPGIYFQGNIKEYSDYLFIQRSDTIIVIDKSDLSNPIYVTLNLSFNYINDIDIKDTVLYVATNNINGLSAYDISDINNPLLINSLSIPYIEHLTTIDSFLFAYNSQSFYRIDISTAFPIILDSLVFGPNRTILSAEANNQAAFISLGDATNFNEMIGNFVFDISMINNPTLIDSTAISINNFNSFLSINDSLLYTYTDIYSMIIYNITNIDSIAPTDSIEISYQPNDLVIDDTLLFIMNGPDGFDIHKKSTPFTYTTVARHKVGEWIADIQASSTGFIFASGNDSVYVFDKTRLASETFGDYTFITQANQMSVIDSFLIETRLDGYYSIRLSSISNLPTIDSLSTFYNGISSYLMYINIWGQRLYNWVNGQGIEIFDISNPSNPVLLTSNIPQFYDGFYNNILFDFNASSSYIDLYDATATPPQFIKQVYSLVPDCGGGTLWDTQRPLKHFFGVNLGSCFFQLDFSDTSNIFYTTTKPMLGMNGSEVQLAKVRNSILYLPGVYGYNLYIYDVCDIEHFRKISDFKLNRFVEGIVLTDSTLFISFGGYIASYDVSNIEPCLILSIPEQKENEDKITIYPNPSNGNFSLQFTPFDNETNIKIINTLGQTIFQKEIHTTRYQMTTINFTVDIVPGLYFVKLSGKDLMLMKKIIIE